MWTLVPDVLLKLTTLTYSYARSDLYQLEDLADTAKPTRSGASVVG